MTTIPLPGQAQIEALAEVVKTWNENPDSKEKDRG